MKRPTTLSTLWLILVCATGVFVAPASASNQELLRQHDAELVRVLAKGFGYDVSQLDDSNIDPTFRTEVNRLAKEFREHLQRELPEWIAQERAARQDPNLAGAVLRKSMELRLFNETAIHAIESAGAQYDDAWIEAALSPRACVVLPDHPLDMRMAKIHAAPARLHQVLLEGERALLLRWGSTRKDLPPRPPTRDLVAPEKAVALMRQGLPVQAEPMTPYLARKLFNRQRTNESLSRWERCALHRWWLQSKLASAPSNRMDALTLYRYASMLNVRDLVPKQFNAKSPTQPASVPEYPAAANLFSTEGRIRVEVSTDSNGKALSATVLQRNVQVPGIRNNRPVAFEALLDDASIEYGMQRRHPASPPKAGTFEFEIDWKLSKDAHEEN